MFDTHPPIDKTQCIRTPDQCAASIPYSSDRSKAKIENDSTNPLNDITVVDGPNTDSATRPSAVAPLPRCPAEKSYLVFAKGVLPPASDIKRDYGNEILTYVQSPLYKKTAEKCLSSLNNDQIKPQSIRTQALADRLLTWQASLHEEDTQEAMEASELKSQWAHKIGQLNLHQTGKLLNAFRRLNARVAVSNLENRLSEFDHNEIIDFTQFERSWPTLSDQLKDFWSAPFSTYSTTVSAHTHADKHLAYSRMSRFELFEQTQAATGLSISKLEALALEVGARVNLALTCAENIHLQLAFHLNDAQTVQFLRRVGEIKFFAEKVPAPKPFSLFVAHHLHPLGVINSLLRPNHSFIVTAVPGEPCSSIISSLGNREGKLSIVDQTDPEHRMHRLFGAMDRNGWRFGQTQKGKIAFIELPFDPQLVKEASQNLKTAQDINDVSELRKLLKLFKRIHVWRAINIDQVNKMKSLLLRVDMKDNGQYRILLPNLRQFIHKLSNICGKKPNAAFLQEKWHVIQQLKQAIQVSDSLPYFGLIHGPTCQTFSTIAIHYIAKRHREEGNLAYNGQGQTCTGYTVREAIKACRKQNRKDQNDQSKQLTNAPGNGTKVIIRGLLPVKDDQALASEVMRLSANTAWLNKLSFGVINRRTQRQPELLKMIADPNTVIRNIYETPPIECP